MTKTAGKKKGKALVGFWIKSKGTNNRVRLLQHAEAGSDFYEFPWLWKYKIQCNMKKVRITIEEI